MLQSTDKVGTACVKPWQLVKEQYLDILVLVFFYLFFQEMKCFNPVGSMVICTKLNVHGMAKVLHLALGIHIIHTCYSEKQLALKQFFYKICLANTPSPIDGNELRPAAFHVRLQISYLSLSTDNVFFHNVNV